MEISMTHIDNNLEHFPMLNIISDHHLPRTIFNFVLIYHLFNK